MLFEMKIQYEDKGRGQYEVLRAVMSCEESTPKEILSFQRGDPVDPAWVTLLTHAVALADDALTSMVVDGSADDVTAAESGR